MKKRKLSLQQYIDDRNADVTHIFKKHKLNSNDWSIVHYFYIRLDNVKYLDNTRKHEELNFENYYYVNNLINDVNKITKRAKADLKENERQEFENRKDETNSYYYNNTSQSTYVEDSNVLDNKLRLHAEKIEDELNIEIVNKFKCQLCGSDLNHVFIAQHNETHKKIVLGKMCVKILVPHEQEQYIINTLNKTKRIIHNVKKHITKNTFNLQEHIANARITEASLVKQIILIKKAFPNLNEDDSTQKAIDTLCFIRNRTIKTCFLAWKNYLKTIKKFIHIIHTVLIKKLMSRMNQWCAYVDSFKEVLDFNILCPVRIQDHTNVIITLLENEISNTTKQCFLKLPNVTFSVHVSTYNFYGKYIKINCSGYNTVLLNTIHSIETSLGCTRLSPLRYPVTLKVIDETKFYKSGELFTPCINQSYTDCTVTVLLKTYNVCTRTSNNDVFEKGVSRICVMIQM